MTEQFRCDNVTTPEQREEDERVLRRDLARDAKVRAEAFEEAKRIVRDSHAVITSETVGGYRRAILAALDRASATPEAT